MNKKEMDITGVSLWHSLGYKGKGINIANLERTATDAPHFNGKFHDPFNISSDYGHGGLVMGVMHQVAPDADLYILPTNFTQINGNVGGDFAEKTIPFIKEHVDVVGQSMSSKLVHYFRDKLIEEQHDNSTWLVSAGNNAYDRFNKMAHNNVRIAIGAVHMANDGTIRRARYSSIDDELDFMGFSSIDTYNRNGSVRRSVTGTSFSNPFVCGMVALVKQFFYEKTGVRLNQRQMFDFMLDNCVDMGEEGHNEYYGHGLFVLPHPDKIDVYKYIGKERVKMKDIQGHWAQEDIEKCIEQGIIKGYPDGTFKPDATVTRAELATIIQRLRR